jgi:hypothetical protein
VTDILYYEQCGIPKNIKIEFDDTTHASMPSLLPRNNDDDSSTSSGSSMPVLIQRFRCGSVSSDDSSAEGGLSKPDDAADFPADFSALESHVIPQDPTFSTANTSGNDKFLNLPKFPKLAHSETLQNLRPDSPQWKYVPEATYKTRIIKRAQEPQNFDAFMNMLNNDSIDIGPQFIKHVIPATYTYKKESTRIKTREVCHGSKNNDHDNDEWKDLPDDYIPDELDMESGRMIDQEGMFYKESDNSSIPQLIYSANDGEWQEIKSKMKPGWIEALCDSGATCNLFKQGNSKIEDPERPYARFGSGSV